MKRILTYIFVAVVLGVATMLAPFALFISEMDTQAERFYTSPAEYMQTKSAETEQIYGIQPLTHSTDTAFIVFLSVFSFLIALGVASYFKRKMFSGSLP